MAEDLKVIKQLEKQVGKKLEQLELEKIWGEKAYAIDENGNVIGLSLFNAELTDISALKELKQVTTLDLSYNKITDISPLKELKQVTTLDLSYNKITDISPLTELSNLKTLDLRNNKIPHLPREIVDLNMEIKWTDEYFRGGINLYGNPLEIPPVDIVKKGKEAVRTWFKSLVGEMRALNEVSFPGAGALKCCPIINKKFLFPFFNNPGIGEWWR